MPLSKFMQFHECKQVNGANARPPLPDARFIGGLIKRYAAVNHIRVTKRSSAEHRRDVTKSRGNFSPFGAARFAIASSIKVNTFAVA
jgi:hypothetical protein